MEYHLPLSLQANEVTKWEGGRNRVLGISVFSPPEKKMMGDAGTSSGPLTSSSQ